MYASYKRFAAYLKWLTAVLLAYVLTAVLARRNWSDALWANVIRTVRWDASYV